MDERDDPLDGKFIKMTSTTKNATSKETTAYNISAYRTSCRTCKDMEVNEYEKHLLTKKQYKRTSLLDAPNTGFAKAHKKSNVSSFGNMLRAPKPSLNLEKARELHEQSKGKMAPMQRYNVT